MSVNRVTLVGRLGQDPDTRFTPSGDAVTNVSLATSEKWTDKDGDKQEATEWHNLVFFKRLAEIAGEFLRKGSQIYVEGKLKTRKWTDKNEVVRYTTEIIVEDLQMLGGGKADSEGGEPAPAKGKAAAKPKKN